LRAAARVSLSLVTAAGTTRCSSQVGGRKARYRRGGFATREAAVVAWRAILDGPADHAAAGAWTVARWLRYWLKLAEPHLRPSTLHGYRDHIDRYLVPSLGRITLADLTGKRLHACFDLLARQRTKNGTLIAASTVDRVRATLRSALNAAVREGLIPSNPFAQVRLGKPVRPHPVIWTDERVEAWRRDGIRPPVAVWTLRQLITFLTGVENDRLAALWWLIALRGLRGGRAALDRDDLDSDACELTIARQLVALPGELYCGPPKSRDSIRTIALDEAGTRRLVDQAVRQTVELLRHQFTEQRRCYSRTRTGPGWRLGRPRPSSPLEGANVIDPAALAVRTVIGNDLNGIDAQSASLRGLPEPVERRIESHRLMLQARRGQLICRAEAAGHPACRARRKVLIGLRVIARPRGGRRAVRAGWAPRAAGRSNPARRSSPPASRAIARPR
jgi:hypothetical protein